MKKSASWLEKKQLTELIIYCRGLKKKDRKTKEDIAIDHFGSDGPKALRDLQILLSHAYYTILSQQGKVFGPVQCKLRRCANVNCNMELEPWGPGDEFLQKCPRCKGTTWKTIDTPYFWYTTTKEIEAKEVVRRWAVNIEGNFRRFSGGEEYPELSSKLTECLGLPARDMLNNPETKRAAKELMAPLITCPNCQSQTFQAQFCANCGTQLVNK